MCRFLKLSLLSILTVFLNYFAKAFIVLKGFYIFVTNLDIFFM